MVQAIRRFKHLPESTEVGLNEALAAKGEALLAALRTEDMEAVHAAAARSESTATLRELEAELSNLLASVEKRAAIVFKRGSVELRRYRMTAIRNYVAVQHGGGSAVVAPTAFVLVGDPDPSFDG